MGGARGGRISLLDTTFDFCTIFMPLNTFPYSFKNHLFLAHGHTKKKRGLEFGLWGLVLRVPS